MDRKSQTLKHRALHLQPMKSTFKVRNHLTLFISPFLQISLELGLPPRGSETLKNPAGDGS